MTHKSLNFANQLQKKTSYVEENIYNSRHDAHSAEYFCRN